MLHSAATAYRVTEEGDGKVAPVPVAKYLTVCYS